MSDRFLDKVYGARGTTATRALYDAWSTSYDAELEEQGYVTPARCSAALARYLPDKELPILDFGCGTGLSGLALKRAGFQTIDGVDLSADMLEQARAKMIYREQWMVTPTKPLPPDTNIYAAISAIGVLGAGAAPISTFDTLMKGLRRGGLLVFSLNDHALQDRTNEARVNEWLDCGAATLLLREYGDHLPGIGLKSNVYVLEKK